MSGRRALGPGGTLTPRSPAAPVPEPRTPYWVPVDQRPDTLAQQLVLVAQHALRTEPWRELLDGLDANALQRAAAEAEAAGTTAAVGVTSRVRAALRALARWDQALGELHAELTAAAGEAGPCERAREAGRADEIRLRQAWARLAEAVLRYHHGGGPSPEVTRVW